MIQPMQAASPEGMQPREGTDASQVADDRTDASQEVLPQRECSRVRAQMQAKWRMIEPMQVKWCFLRETAGGEGTRTDICTKAIAPSPRMTECAPGGIVASSAAQPEFACMETMWKFAEEYVGTFSSAVTTDLLMAVVVLNKLDGRQERHLSCSPPASAPVK
jgi:hypothetical protein